MSWPGIELLRPIGRGGMGVVWEGRLAGTDGLVAIKVVTAEATRRPQYRDALEAEALAVAGLDHPGIVRVYDFGRVPEGVLRSDLVPGSPYLVMERASGSLATTLTEAPSWARVRHILLTLLDALGHAHARGLVHRDLKPENVLVVGGQVKLADFGLAWSLDEQRGALSGLAGSPEYMAPEQVARQPRLGPWTDLYALGCLGWWLATGSSPFGGSSAVLHSHVHDTPPPLVPLQPMPEGYEAWLRALLQKNPRERVAWAADAMAALRVLPDAPEPTHVVPFRSRRSGVATETQSDLEPIPDAVAAPTEAAIRPAPVPPDWRAPNGSAHPVAIGAGAYWLLRPHVFGREAERDRLWEPLREVSATGRPHLVVLRGPAGVGKTHLAEWFVERAAEVGAANVIRVGFLPRGSGRDAISVSAPWFTRTFADRGAMEGAIRAGAETRVPRPEDFAQRISGLLFAGGAGAPMPGLSPEERQAVITGMLELLGQERPALIYMDDVHWEPTSLDFFAAALDHAKIPMLMIATLAVGSNAATDRVSVLSMRDDVDVVDLGPLAPEEWVGFVEALVHAPEDLVREIAAWADGLPLFAIQLVGLWAQEGHLEVTRDGRRLRDGATPTLPEGRDDLWRRRVAGLPVDQLRALTVAARLGAEFDPVVWRTACASEGIGAPDDLLQEFVRRGLLVRRRRGGPLTFVHPTLAAWLAR